VKQTYGYTKQGAGHGYTGVKGLNALLATVSTPTSAPVIAATRLRRRARRQTLHLPTDWPWENPWQNLASAALGPPRHKAV
jgi:hypothetical protein